MLRKIRLTLAAVFFVAVTLLFLDFTGTLHRWIGWTAEVQFLPALLTVCRGCLTIWLKQLIASAKRLHAICRNPQFFCNQFISEALLPQLSDILSLLFCHKSRLPPGKYESPDICPVLFPRESVFPSISFGKRTTP